MAPAECLPQKVDPKFENNKLAGMRLSFPSILVAFAFVFIVFSQCKNPYQQKCQEICGFYSSCVEKQFPDTVGADPKQKSFIAMECESGCLREQGYALPCYEAEKNLRRFYSLPDGIRVNGLEPIFDSRSVALKEYYQS